MFDDEADMMPQSWAAAPDENLPAIDVVLNHRLRQHTGMQHPQQHRPDN